MESVYKLKNQLKEINTVLHATYGRYGKSALIQSTNKETLAKSFLSTNDGISILKSITFDENSLIKLAISTIQCHSVSSGDNCKTLFFYQFAYLKVLTTHINTEDSDQILAYLRSNSLYKVYQVFLNQWLDILKKDDFFKIFNSLHVIDDFKSVMPNLAVIYDLKNSNETFSNISSQLVIDLINYNLADDLQILPDILVQILNDFDTYLFYSDKESINKTRLFTNGFLIDRRFLVKIPSLFEGCTPIKVVLLKKLPTDQAETGSNTFLQINSNLEQSLLQCFISGDEIKFSVEFLESLNKNGINLILTAGSLSDFKKAQLSSINCSCIGYIQPDYIEFLCRKLGVECVLRPDEIDKMNIIYIKEIETVENEKLFYFRLSDINQNNSNKIWSIHFCAPAKMFLTQFKAYFLKVFRNFSNLFECPSSLFCQENLRIIALKCGQFEGVSSQIFTSLARSEANSNGERLFFEFISKVFDELDFTLNKDRGQGMRIKRISVVSECLATPDIEVERFEAFMLKVKCFFKSFQFLQSISRIEKVYSVKKRINNLKKDSGSDSE